MPGTLVSIAPNGPRYSTGARGLGSQVSMWPGPPLSQNRTTLLSAADERTAPSARNRAKSASVRPPAPSAPAVRKLRRETAGPEGVGSKCDLPVIQPSFYACAMQYAFSCEPLVKRNGPQFTRRLSERQIAWQVGNGSV